MVSLHVQVHRHIHLLAFCDNQKNRGRRRGLGAEFPGFPARAAHGGTAAAPAACDRLPSSLRAADHFSSASAKTTADLAIAACSGVATALVRFIQGLTHRHWQRPRQRRNSVPLVQAAGGAPSWAVLQEGQSKPTPQPSLPSSWHKFCLPNAVTGRLQRRLSGSILGSEPTLREPALPQQPEYRHPSGTTEQATFSHLPRAHHLPPCFHHFSPVSPVQPQLLTSPGKEGTT